MNSVLDIHIIRKDKKYIAFHPDSFSLFYVNDEIGRVLRYYELKTKDINIIAETFKIQVKYIENILENISEEVTPNYAKNIELPNEGPISLNLLISQDCNLRCRYCYADHGTYGCDKKLMDFDVAKNSIDKLLNKNHNNYIVFFGGEPFFGG